MKFALLFPCMVCVSLAIFGCATDEAKNEAIAMIRSGRAGCVVARDGRIVASASGRGVSPILEILDSNPGAMEGAAVVDKVVGRASAFVAISGGASSVHGEVIGEDAVRLLESKGVEVSWTKVVPQILNNSRTAPCPMEMAVTGIDDPAEAVNAIRRKIAELARMAGKLP
ncbi:MAG: DUF1893 domain-containing protein [Victivallaceae bacterium]|nr:DUF1893 domain-containing protein [Victivallaceae bacterium]